jgi:hypothetical protein
MRVTLAALALVAGAAVHASPTVLTFDDAAIGAAPPGFFFVGARQPNPGLWEVGGVPRSRYLVHTGDPDVKMRGISIANISAAAPANLKITTKLRLVDADRAGGLVWRYRDPNNFYFMSLVLTDQGQSPLGMRYAALFRVTGGNRILLDSFTNLELDLSAWHTVSVVHDGEQIRASINGIGVLKARDAMIADGGHAGVWSAGNSTAWFDDVTVENSPE